MVSANVSISALAASRISFGMPSGKAIALELMSGFSFHFDLC